MSLFETYRPKTYEDVIGQPRALATLKKIRKTGLGGRAYWIFGASGTGKTSLGMLIAGEIADPLAFEKLQTGSVTPATLNDVERTWRCRAIGDKDGRAIIMNEAHGLRVDTVRKLLDMIEDMPKHVVMVFTTTLEGHDEFLGDCIDADALLSRMVLLPLELPVKAFAERCVAIAAAEGLPVLPLEAYEQILVDYDCNLRAVLSLMERGAIPDETVAAEETEEAAAPQSSIFSAWPIAATWAVLLAGYYALGHMIGGGAEDA